MPRVMGISRILFYFLAVPGITFAINNLVAKKEKEISSQEVLRGGLYAFYSGEYREAKEKFDQYIEREPDDPVGFLRDFHARFLLLRLEQKSKDAPKTEDNRKEYQHLSYLVSAGISKAEDKIEVAEKSGDAKSKDFYLYVQAYLYLAKAGVEWGNGHPLDACSSTKTALEIAGRSGYEDARYLEGMVNYLGGTRSWAVRSLILAPMGIPHDRDNGLRLICESLRGNNGPYAEDIRFMIFAILTDKRMKEKDRRSDEAICRSVLPDISAEELCRELGDKYPNNKTTVVCRKTKQ